MRFPQWFTPVLGLTLTAATCHSAAAQYGPAEGGAAWPPAPAAPLAGGASPGFGGMGGGVPMPLTGGLPPAAYGPAPEAFVGSVPPPPAPPLAGPPAAPPGNLPWPNISPMEYQFSEHRVADKGLWWWEGNNRGRQWFFNAAYMHTNFSKPKGVVGDPRAQTYLERITPIISQAPFSVTGGGGGGGGNTGGGNSNGGNLSTLFNEFAGLQPTPYTQLGYFPLTNVPVGIDPFGYNYYSAQNASAVSDITASGFRLNLGAMNPDDTGFVIDAFYTGVGNKTLSMRDQFIKNRRAPSQLQPGLTNEILNNPLGTVRNPAGAFSGVGDVADPFNITDPLQQPISPFIGAGQVGAGGTVVATPGVAILEQNLFNLGGLPVDNGTFRTLSDGTVVGGTTIPYDLEFRLQDIQQAAGTSLSYMFSSFIKKDHYHVRVIGGARFLYIKEAFQFYGADSGLAYYSTGNGGQGGGNAANSVFPLLKFQSLPDYIDNDGDGVIDPAGAVEIPSNNQNNNGGGTGGNNQQSTNATFVNLKTLADSLGVYSPGAYTAYLNNTAESYLAGPEIGLSYDAGGNKFRILGQSKFALVGVHERVSMSGNNIGEASNIGNNIPTTTTGGTTTTTQPFYIQNSPLLQPTVTNPNPNYFADRQTNTHIAPVLQQSFTGELAIFGYVPWINRMTFFRDAKLTGGVNFLWVGDVVRPSQSILWRANPRAGLFPSIRPDHSDWFMFNYTVGAQFPF